MQVLEDFRSRAATRQEDTDSFGLEWRLVPTDPEVAAAEHVQRNQARWNREHAEREAERERRWATGTRLMDIGIPYRYWRKLEKEDIYTAEELAARTAAEVLSIDGIGPKRLEEHRRLLAAVGLAYKEEEAVR